MCHCCPYRVPVGGPLCFQILLLVCPLLTLLPQLLLFILPPLLRLSASKNSPSLSLSFSLSFYLARAHTHTHTPGLERGQGQPLPLFYSSMKNTEGERHRQKEEEREGGRSVAALKPSPSLPQHAEWSRRQQLHKHTPLSVTCTVTHIPHAHTTTTTAATTTPHTHSDGCQAQWEASRQGESLRRKRRNAEGKRRKEKRVGGGTLWIRRDFPLCECASG